MQGNVEELLVWHNSMSTILNEQKVTGTPSLITSYTRVLANLAKNHYGNGVHQTRLAEDRRVTAATAAGQVAVTDYSKLYHASLQAIGAIIFPYKAYTAQQTWLQLTVQKPVDMTI